MAAPTKYIWLDVTVRDVLARYEVGETIGVGGFAVVKRGKDRQTGEVVAIKVIDKWRYATEDNSEREIRILSKVSHPHCISLHAVYVTSRKVYIITELVSGGELLDKVTEKGVFSEAHAAYILKQVLEGVAYLHNKGIVHRDLKLENLLLVDSSPKSAVKIADFGLSKVFSKETTLSTICGSPQYMAPELLMMEEKQNEYSPAVDIWSVGVILFILLSGYSPFDDTNDAALFEKIKTGRYDNNDPVWDNVSDGAKDLVARMLTVNAEARFSAVECLEHPWLREQAAIMEARPDDAPSPPLAHDAMKALATRGDAAARLPSVRVPRDATQQTTERRALAEADAELAAGHGAVAEAGPEDEEDDDDDMGEDGETGFDPASYL